MTRNYILKAHNIAGNGSVYVTLTPVGRRLGEIVLNGATCGVVFAAFACAGYFMGKRQANDETIELEEEGTE